MLTQVIPKTQLSVRENLHWLFILRNLMISSEAAILFLAIFGFGLKLPQTELLFVILSIITVNIYTWLRLKTNEDVTELEIFSHLIVDVCGIACLLYLTGGASNPIIWVFLLPLIVTGILLPQTYAWYMVMLTSSAYTILIAYNIPLPVLEPDISDPKLISSDVLHQLHLMSNQKYFNLHIFGMWSGFVFSAGLVAYFVVELSKTVREQERTLAEARENELRNERVVSLATLAASAAHDMGTPLGTMAIITHEVLQDYSEQQFPDLHEKTQILEQQIKRCKSALSVMSESGGEMRAESGTIMDLVDYIDEVLLQWRTHNPKTKLSLVVKPSIHLPSKLIAERTLTHSIINILNNAAEATIENKGIELHTYWDNQEVNLEIRDFGKGLPETLLRYKGLEPMGSRKQGLGVGLFLACTTIKQLSGRIEFYNHPKIGGGCVRISLPLLPNEKKND
ncbi:MAG: sensor histidine kinase [Methylococcales bacterium]|nr:sensor histidine kinase [Methylococcales bacterium]